MSKEAVDSLFEDGVPMENWRCLLSISSVNAHVAAKTFGRFPYDWNSSPRLRESEMEEIRGSGSTKAPVQVVGENDAQGSEDLKRISSAEWRLDHCPLRSMALL